MILDAKQRQLLVAETFDSAVVEIDMRDDAALGFEGSFLDCKAVILAGDFDPARI